MNESTPKVAVVRIDFRDERTPYSTRFQDVYFSALDGISESRYVYLEGSGYLGALGEGRPRIEIGEVGFGVGLNFVLTLDAFLKESKPGQVLHYHSFERFPVHLDDLKRLYGAYPELSEASGMLLDHYPILTPGVHSLRMAGGRVRLWLSLGEAREQMSLSDFRVDHWYWDGFAPKQNPDAFDPRLFAEVARLSRSGSRGASFTSAGWVRRAIEAAGFRIEKRPGFGKKRECIRAEFVGPGIEGTSPLPPWFSGESSVVRPPEAGPVGVIGAGLAGSAISRRLAEAGYEVLIFDPEGPGNRTSGNPLGLYNLQISKKPNPISRFAQAALAEFLRELRDLGVPHHTGILRTDFRDPLPLIESNYPEDSYEVTPRGIRLKVCGVVNPRELCRIRIHHPKIRLFRNRVSSIEVTGGGFLIRADGLPPIECTQVVSTLGADFRLPDASPPVIKHLDPIPMRPIRGQIILVPPSAQSRNLQETLVEEGYASPALPALSGVDAHLIGATYQAKTVLPNQESIDRDQLIRESAKWSEFSGSLPLDSIQSRVGWRLSSPDKLPVIGPLCDPKLLAGIYGNAFRGGPVRSLPPIPAAPGEWTLTALGSRGITFSSIGSLLLCDWMTGERLSIELDLIEHLHPARFFIRKLKRPGIS
jgi:tRNA 5-methylaminomethyl-2-thiouridine biosynthesis bifunctional protein